MKIKTFQFLAVTHLLLIGGIQAAEKAHVLYKSKQPLPVGAVMTKTEHIKMNMTLAIENEGQKMNGTMVMTNEEKEIHTVKSKTEISVKTEIKNSAQTGNIAGQKLPDAKNVDPIEGKTVILTKKAGKWSAKLVGEDTEDSLQEDVEKMAKSMNKNTDKSIIGTKPRKVGETWTVDAADVPDFLGDDTKNTTGSFKVTFKKVEIYEGEECAVLHYDVEMKGETESGEIIGMKGKAIEYRSLKWCEGVKFSLKGTMTIDNEAKGMHIEGPMTMTGLKAIKTP